MVIVRRFLALGWRERWLALEAAGWLALARLALVLLPFRWISPRLGRPDDAREPRFIPNPDQTTTAAAVGRAVRRAARHTPWQTLCLPQAMAARMMLNRRAIPSTLHIGVDLDDEGRRILAHAWLDVGTTSVVGGDGSSEFQPIARFR